MDQTLTKNSVEPLTSLNVSENIAGISQIPANHTHRGKKFNYKQSLNSQEITEVTPYFLVMRKKVGDFTKVSPFLIDRYLCECVGIVKNVKKIKEGLLIESANISQSKKLLSLKHFQEDEVEVVPHTTLNYCKGVVVCSDLLNCDVAEIQQNLTKENVVDVKRITTRKDGSIVNTASLILTFNKRTLPNKIKAGIYVLDVRPYIPAPLRCFKCQEFGHTSVRCNKEQICVCGNAPHPGSSCPDPIKCINCQGQHSARSRNCPVYKEEAEIQRIKTLEKISFSEAKKRIKSLKPNPTMSYAQVTKNPPENLVKDVIEQMLPYITEICTKIVKSCVTEMPPPQFTPEMPPPQLTSEIQLTENTTSNSKTSASMSAQDTSQIDLTIESNPSKRKQPDAEIQSSQDDTYESEASQSSAHSQPMTTRSKKRKAKPVNANTRPQRDRETLSPNTNIHSSRNHQGQINKKAA